MPASLSLGDVVVVVVCPLGRLELEERKAVLWDH